MQFTDGVGLVQRDPRTNNERPEFTKSQANDESLNLAMLKANKKAWHVGNPLREHAPALPGM